MASTAAISDNAKRSNYAGVVFFACATFTSAFLLFQVQPLIGKYILPWFGGTPAVWTTCMLVFQVLLFAGYAYAHFTTQCLSVRGQALLHLVLLALALSLLPITPDAAWKPEPANSPALRIILLTTCTVGLPYFLLSSTGPLLQRWFSRAYAGISPYRLYALSNVGSLLALLTYPIFFETNFTTSTQAWIWSAGFVVFAALCALCALFVARPVSENQGTAQPKPTSVDESETSSITSEQMGVWFILAMLPSVLLLAVTNQVCMDVAVIPFLWVIPLALYLISFILTFDAQGWYLRRFYLTSSLILVVLASILSASRPGVPFLAQIAIYFSTLFCCCMACHGELVRLRPGAKYLTHFYLTISAGGAVGGIFVGLFAPMLFSGFQELQIALLVFVLVNFALQQNMRNEKLAQSGSARPRMGKGVLVLGGVACVLVTQLGSNDGSLDIHRNFYGVLRIRENAVPGAIAPSRALVHGRIIHGIQFLDDNLRSTPTGYFARESGIGKLLSILPADRPCHVGIIGLGVGTLANYGRNGDRFRFYEINPDVIAMANEHFSCLSDSAAEITVVEGDARLVLESEPSQQFDVLVLDAFSGDAIPVHLLTQEAMRIYRQHLKPEGVLACHISNLHFDLRPVVAGLATEFNLNLKSYSSSANPRMAVNEALWALLASDSSQLPPTMERNPPAQKEPILWTDERSNLFEILQ